MTSDYVAADGGKGYWRLSRAASGTWGYRLFCERKDYHGPALISRDRVYESIQALLRLHRMYEDDPALLLGDIEVLAIAYSRSRRPLSRLRRVCRAVVSAW